LQIFIQTNLLYERPHTSSNAWGKPIKIDALFIVCAYSFFALFFAHPHHRIGVREIFGDAPESIPTEDRPDFPDLIFA
jgi:hypothetical protein